MRTVIVSSLTGDGEFCDVAVRWVHSLRHWSKFDGDILLFMDDEMDDLAELDGQVERRSMQRARTSIARTDLDLLPCALKPFFVHEATEGYDDDDVILVADVDALAVRSLQPMFEHCARIGKIMPAHDQPGGGKTIGVSDSRGYFTRDELRTCNKMGMEVACAGFILGPVGRMRSMADDWLITMATKYCQPVKRPGMQDQSAFNYWLFKNEGLWEPMPHWVLPFGRGPVWQVPSRDTLIWHFFHANIDKQEEMFALKNSNGALW